MAASSLEHSDEARAALQVIVAEHGPEALSRPGIMSNLLKDFLPDAPAIARILVAGAEDRIADQLREYAEQGLDVTIASGLVASTFASATMLAPETCAWVVNEFATALGLTATDAPPATTAGPATMVVTDQVTQPHQRVQAAQTHDVANVITEGAPTVAAQSPVPVDMPRQDMVEPRTGADSGQRRAGRRKWPLLAAGGVAAVVAVVVIALAVGSSAPRHLTLGQLRTGDCLTGSNIPLGGGGSWPYKVTAVPCTHGHVAEVFLADNGFWKASASYPGSASVIRAGDARCRSGFSAYVGLPPQDSKYNWGDVLPDTSSSWQEGFRSLDCYAYLGGTTLRHSIKGSRR